MLRLLPVFLMLPVPALAHPGDHGHSSLSHFLTEPDHLAALALVAVLVLAALLKFGARR